MRYVAYTSKLYSGGILIVMLALGAGVFAFREKMPAVALGIFGVLILMFALACLFALFNFEPVISIDEDGFHYRRHFLKKIDWSDVAAVQREARRVELADGSVEFAWSDSTRVVNVHVSNIGKYAAPMLAWILSRLAPSTIPDCVCLRVECLGTTAKSAELHAALLHYSAGRNMP